MSLTEGQKNEIALGYNWEPDWDYEYFINRNPELSYNIAYDLYMNIEDRYIQFVYENESKQ